MLESIKSNVVLNYIILICSNVKKQEIDSTLHFFVFFCINLQSYSQSGFFGTDDAEPLAALTMAMDLAMRFTYSGQSIVLRSGEGSEQIKRSQRDRQLGRQTVRQSDSQTVSF
jgi:hypothetical protein